jgi:hypothetical protein
MTIRGCLDAVEPLQIRGWAFYPDDSDLPITVEIFLDERRITSTTANLHRQDLEQSGYGDGCHAFVVNLETRLDDAEIKRVSARALTPDGTFVPLPAATPDDSAADPATSLSHGSVEFTVSHVDPVQQPVFILGAARSGTSAIAQALLKLGVFEGHQEGHMLDLLAHLAVATNKFYQLQHDEVVGNRDTTIARVPTEFFHDRLDGIFIDLGRRLFPRSRWVDKTPNSNMVNLAPRFKKIWPNSRFIFMRRRFLENAASRSRKFPEHEFARSAQEWGAAMDAWLRVRSQLHGCAVEIDQKFLAEEPELVASRLRPFLSLSETEEARLAQALRFDLPERTSTNGRESYDIEEMGWQETERGYFAQYCESSMTAFGYSTTPSYYLSGFETDGFIYL